MKHAIFLFIPLILLGAGCFGGSGSTGSNGSLWRTNDAGATWDQLSALPGATGVGSIAGVNVTSVEVDPSDSSTYYMGTESNGLLYTHDYGSTWARFEDSEVKSGYIVDVEVNPETLCTIYVLKSDRVLKSNNCGREWKSVYSEARSDVSLTAMEIDWYTPDTLWIGTSDGDITRTQDGGASWDTLYHISGDVTDIMVSNSDSRIIMYTTAKHGYRRTTDGGENWEEVKKDLDKQFDEADDIYSITQDRLGNTVVMNTKYGLIKSRDQGATWEHVDILTSPGEVRIWSVAMNPENASEMYYATGDIFYTSTSGGSSWQTESLPSSRAAKTMIVHPSSTEYVLVGFAVQD